MQPLPIPEHLPGEPKRLPPPPLQFGIRIIVAAVLLKLFVLVSLWLWPLYFLGALIWGWPPNVPRLAQILRYLKQSWDPNIPSPGIPFLNRVWLTLCILRKAAFVPIWGLAWLLDDMLYGKELKNTSVIKPLFEISAARSGSTQMARYIEDDPNLAAPSAAQCVFPYLWMWRLAPHTIGRLLSKDEIRHKIEAGLPPEFIQRHEGDPFKTDTFEGALYLAHLNTLSVFFGPHIMIQDFGFHTFGEHNQDLWTKDFIDFLDGIARKTLLDSPPAPNGQAKRLFVKGHFLCAADAVEEKYPDAQFLTIIREPAPRLKSAINFLRSNPVSHTLGEIPWTWLAAALEETEASYCEVEQAWFTRKEGANRYVVRFSDYVKDLEGTMKDVYTHCLDTPELPPHVPREHPPRERTNYLLNRSLETLGIDEDQLNKRLSSYIEWCRGEI